LRKNDRAIKEEILFYWILHNSESSVSISSLLYGLPVEVRGWWTIKDSTLRTHINKKAKEMEQQGYLIKTYEKTSEGYDRQLFARVEGNERLIPDWFKDKVVKHVAKKKKINCKSCAYRDHCYIRESYSNHKKNHTLTEENKKELLEMCKAVKGSMDDLRQRREI
jgi:hypothetical protein